MADADWNAVQREQCGLRMILAMIEGAKWRDAAQLCACSAAEAMPSTATALRMAVTVVANTKRRDRAQKRTCSAAGTVSTTALTWH